MTNDGGQQPEVPTAPTAATVPTAPMVTTKAEQRRVGLIVAAVVSVAVIIIGAIVIVGALGSDDETATTSPATVATTAEGGTGATASTGRSEPPADPCDDAVLSADLQLDGATAAMCDGTWATAQSSDGTVIAKFADDNTWHLMVDTATTAACRTEILNAGVPAAAVDAAEWTCELTTKPIAWADEEGSPYSFGQMGGHVWAAQNVLAIWGLMPHKSVDGYLGPETLQALVKFQIAAGLPATGAVDQPTIQAMGIDPTTRVASEPILIQESALNNVYLGSSVDGTIGMLSEILGPPDVYLVPEFHAVGSACDEYRIFTWSGLTVYFTKAATGSYAFTAWIYEGQPDLQIRARDGRTTGVPVDQTSPEPELVTMQDEGAFVLYQWPDGLLATAGSDGTILSMRGGDWSCFRGLD